jgi:hypothetical protein
MTKNNVIIVMFCLQDRFGASECHERCRKIWDATGYQIYTRGRLKLFANIVRVLNPLEKLSESISPILGHQYLNK